MAIKLTRLSSDAYWRQWDDLRRALLGLYGSDRTLAIMESRDPKTNEDVKRWKRLGVKS